MRINQIIREKRREQSLTQEQVAAYLGVSAPAVNKWEKGSTYPDITLLPALARLLKTDLNTLLSFQEDLTDKEIGRFTEEMDRVAREEGYERAFQMGKEKIQEFPTCEQLLYEAVFYLDGALFLYDVPDRGRYQEQLEGYYRRMAESRDPTIQQNAVGMLISHHRIRKDFAKAKELIDTLPSSSIDREEQLAVLYTQQEEYEEAEKRWEHRILTGVCQIQTALINMMEIAIQEGRMGDASFYADQYEHLCNRFHMAKWTSYTARLQLAAAQKDEEGCLAVLRSMLPAMKDPWQPQESPLYRRMDGKDSMWLAQRLLALFQKELLAGEEFAFIKNQEELIRLAEDSFSQEGEVS